MDYGSMTLAELKALAKEKGIKGTSALKKQELIDILTAGEAVKKPTEDVKPGLKRAELSTANESTPKEENPAVKECAPKEGRPDAKNGGARVNSEQRPIQARIYRPGTTSQNSAQPQQAQRSYRMNPAPQPGAPQTGAPRSFAAQNPATQNPAAQNYPAQNPAVRNGAQPQQASAQAPANRAPLENRELADQTETDSLDSGEVKTGILEVMPDGFGFIRCDNFLPGESDVYVSPTQIRRFNLKTGDIVTGNQKIKTATEKFSALLYLKSVNGYLPSEAAKRPKFEDLTPIFPNERLHLETPGCEPSMRLVDLISPIGKGQRGMIVSQPKAGKTTLLKQIANSLTKNYPSLHLIILLIDERPEEVTDMKESIKSGNVEVIYSTFDELPEKHKRVSEMVIERAKRLVEHKEDVVILLDSITRLARAYNLTCTASGRTLSGGLDPAALYMPKRFFGAARNMREGGSLTVLATALVETGSRMDDVVFEEFKGTGNMELVLDRNLSEKRIFPAVDLPKSGTRREDLLLSRSEMEANTIIRRAFNSSKSDEAVERILNVLTHTRNNFEFIEMIKKIKF